MYHPKLFKITNITTLIELIQQHNLGMMITLQDGVMQSDHLPFYVVQHDDTITLIAHIARANPLATLLHTGVQNVLVVFRGEHGYISPNWYPSKHIHHRHVPTYNYRVVQVHGQAQLINERKFITRAVGTLTNLQEANEPTPWAMKDAPDDYLADELSHIVGLQITVTHIEGKFKLSQNREQADLDNIVATLHEKGQHALADAMSAAYPSKSQP